MDNLIIIGSSERYNGFVFGKYRVDLEVISEIDRIAETRDELEVVLSKENISKTTFEILSNIVHELESYEEMV